MRPPLADQERIWEELADDIDAVNARVDAEARYDKQRDVYFRPTPNEGYHLSQEQLILVASCVEQQAKRAELTEKRSIEHAAVQKQKIDKLRSQVDVLKQQVATLKNAKAALSTKVQTSRARAESLKRQGAKLKDVKASLRSKLEGLRAQVEALKQKIASLEAAREVTAATRGSHGPPSRSGQ